MNFKNPRLWIAVCSALAVSWIALSDIGRTSPGPITAVHQQDPDLSGWTSCSQCHGGWTSTMTESCLECHEVIGTQIEAGEGLHGILEGDLAQSCARCHSEHHGPDFAIVNRRSFANAGVDDPEAFDHRLIGFEMDGAHRELACNECHANADTRVLPEGEFRYYGLEQSCNTCHEDAHDGRYVMSCTKCHGQQDFKQLDSLGHDEFLPLVGGHGEVSCATCHAPNDAHSLEALGLGRRIQKRACVDCHESPHESGFVTGVAQLVGQDEGASCATCHEAEHTSFREGQPTVTPEQHASSGFELVVPHDQASCEDCHAIELPMFADRYPGRRPDNCQACHVDPHGGQFEAGPFGGQNCLACHDRHRFEPHAFTLESHDLTALKLTGTHRETECNECHTVPEDSAPRVFHGTPSTCESCHQDAHRGYFDRFAEELAELEHGSCANCHLTTKFADLPEAGFDHARWTTFNMAGAHEQADCSICHIPSVGPDELGRAFGWVSANYGEFHGCVTCHADPHQGQFDSPDHPQEVDGRHDCERCHVQTSFRSLPNGFDHNLWTGFPLTGAHADADCSVCHEPQRQPDETGRTWKRARGSKCVDCHADPHGGQFRRRGATDCSRCHRSATKFSALYFKHDLHSRFRLGAAHEKLECSACHKPVDIGGVQIVRYRPMSRQCVDCHGDHRDPLRRFKGKKK